MTESSDPPPHVITFTPTPPDSPRRALPRIHRQRHIVAGGLMIGFSVNCPREGDYFDLRKVSDMLKALGVYKDMRMGTRVLRAPGVSGRTFERAVQDGDAISREGIQFCCEAIVNALVDDTSHALGAHRDALIEGLMCHAEYKWRLEPNLRKDDGAPCDALALAIMTYARKSCLDIIPGLALAHMFETGELPDPWFCGEAVAWFILKTREYYGLTQEELCARMGYELDGVRHIRRWEHAECVPELDALEALAQAIAPLQQKRGQDATHQYLVWLKLARLVDLNIREDLVSISQPIKDAPLLTSEWRTSWWKEGMKFKRRRLTGDLWCLGLMNDEEFERCAREMKCGAEPIPSDMFKVLEQRYSHCSEDTGHSCQLIE